MNMREIGGPAQEVAGDPEPGCAEIPEHRLDPRVVLPLQPRQALRAAHDLAAAEAGRIVAEQLGVFPGDAVPKMLADRLILDRVDKQRPVEIPIACQNVVGVKVVIAADLVDDVVGADPDDLALVGDGGDRGLRLAGRL